MPPSTEPVLNQHKMPPSQGAAVNLLTNEGIDFIPEETELRME